MWKWISLVLILILGALIGYGYYYRGDTKLVEEAILLVNDADSSEIQALEHQYALSKAKVLSIKSQELRDRTLIEVDKIYNERKTIFEEAEELKLQIAALMQKEYKDLSTLRASRAKAEELASKIRLTGQAVDVLTSVAEAFTKQQETVSARIAVEERRRAEEERRKAEARRAEAAKEAEAERLRLARAQADLERQRLANEAARRSREAADEAARRSREAADEAARRRREAEPSDCCCKIRVDKGVIFSNWVYEYKRMKKGKCTNPGFWDNHTEGWCVPNSSCY